MGIAVGEAYEEERRGIWKCEWWAPESNIRIDGVVVACDMSIRGDDSHQLSRGISGGQLLWLVGAEWAGRGRHGPGAAKEGKGRGGRGKELGEREGVWRRRLEERRRSWRLVSCRDTGWERARMPGGKAQPYSIR